VNPEVERSDPHEGEPGDAVPPEAAAFADLLLRRGLLVAVIAVVALSLASRLEVWDVLGIPIFLLLLPALAVAQLPLMRHQRIDRRAIYVGSIVTIIGVGIVGGGLAARLGVRAAFQFGAADVWTFIAWTGGLSAAGIAVMGLSLLTDRGGSGEHERFLVQLLPRTGPERGLFALLSLAAGVGEELAYRGYALAALQLLPIGPWAAAVVSSLAFGLLHAYQGPLGVARTAVVGFVFAIGVLLSGSLLPAMAAHAIVDLLAGLVLGPVLIRRIGEREDGDGPRARPTSEPPPLDPHPPAG
jgi:membrane protease YdiL (CAAX protease family)